MRLPVKAFLITVAMFMTTISHAADEEKSEGFLPKVDKPIADTYEPLDGASWNHRRSEELQTLREYQKQTHDKAEAERQLKLRQELEGKIQAPDPGSPQAKSTPPVTENGNKIQISDPE